MQSWVTFNLEPVDLELPHEAVVETCWEIRLPAISVVSICVIRVCVHAQLILA